MALVLGGRVSFSRPLSPAVRLAKEKDKIVFTLLHLQRIEWKLNGGTCSARELQAEKLKEEVPQYSQEDICFFIYILCA